MLKKLLCVMISALMVVSLLPMGVFATDYELVATETVSYTNQGVYLQSYVTELCDAVQNGGYIELDISASDSAGAWIQTGIGYTDYSWSSTCNTTTTWVDAGSSITMTVTSAEFLAAVSDFTNVRGIWIQGGSTLDVTEIRVYAVADDGGVATLSDTSVDEGESITIAFSTEATTDAYYAVEVANTSWTEWYVNETVTSGSTYTISGLDAGKYYVYVGYWVNGEWASDALSTTAITIGGDTSTTTRFIYVNETYHALIVNGHFICSEHDVDSNGYCTVCKEYIGTDDAEATTVTVDGVDYVEAFVYDTAIASGNWNKVTIGDSTLAAALNTEGAVLQVTRDTETLIDYVSGSIYEKFLLGKDDSNYVALSAHGTTVNDEDGLVAYTSDDGTTVTYDGATVYAALSDAGLADLSSYVLISNTSASYNITSVKVLIPVGTVVTETVDVDEPAEDTNSETEDDELDVDDTDAEEVTETNPTTGAVLALVPMAIAGFAVVASKRR